MENRNKITREQIVETALQLMRHKNELRGINMREISRMLGCAHTNIYNYFPSYTALMWETHTALQEIFMTTLRGNLASATSAENRLRSFIETFTQVYFDNKGWFRLAWLEYIGENRPKSNIDAIEKAHDELNQSLALIWYEMTGNVPCVSTVSRVLHNTHCYIIGEVSNYVSGRSLIENETKLKEYIVKEATNILTLCMGMG